MPGTRQALSLLKVGVVLLATTLLAVACAPREEQPNIPLALRSPFVVYTPDSLNDAGRSPSVAFDSQGLPSVSYLLLKAVLKTGDIPPPVIPGQPQPPAVMLANLTANGIWQRTSVTPQKTSPAEGDAPQIGTQEKEAGPVVHTGLAVDGQGKHHVAWSTPSGLFYSTDSAGSFGEPEQVTKSSSVGASIAAASDGTPWISFYAKGSVQVATQSGGGWTTDAVANAKGPGNPWTSTTSIRIEPNGEPIVAFGDKGATVVASKTGGSWTTDRVPGGGGVGVSLALDKDGNPHVAYYDSEGGVHHAHTIKGAAWEVTDIGRTAPSKPSPSPSPAAASPSASPAAASPSPSAQGSPSPQGSPSAKASPSPSASPTPLGPEDSHWGTGIAVDDKGTHYIAWTDTSNQHVVFTTNRSGKFASQPVPNSDNGANPSIAASPDGRSLVISWDDAANEDLNVAISGQRQLVLAFSPPPPGRPSAAASPTGGTQAACKPKGGTNLAIAAPSGAAASGFSEKCLAVASGAAFSVKFTNQDQGVPHNWSLYTDSSGSSRPGGAPKDFPIVTGPGESTYKLKALDAGDYFFRCDVHPTTMNGTLVVAKA